MPLQSFRVWAVWRTNDDEWSRGNLAIYDEQGELVIRHHSCRAVVAGLFARTAAFSWHGLFDVTCLEREEALGLFGPRDVSLCDVLRVNEYTEGVLRLLWERDGEQDMWPVVNSRHPLVMALRIFCGDRCVWSCKAVRGVQLPDAMAGIVGPPDECRPARKPAKRPAAVQSTPQTEVPDITIAFGDGLAAVQSDPPS